MITMINQDNWGKYNVLFRKAWTDLLNNKSLKPLDVEAAQNGKEAFADLAHYFAYIKDLITIKPLYVMLPIDEAPFEINANTRTITVPNDFSKCSGVQLDNYAEIITFTIDRYFDYKDLAAPGTQIAVQWINESANPKVEGVSFIQLVDLETYGAENKIRFGWPITGEMTAAAGNLRFAVRFFTSQTDEDGKITFNYLFNTTPASIPIRPTLSVDFNGEDVVKKTNDFELFSNYITNSMHPSYGIPSSVTFVEGLPVVAEIDVEKDDLTLVAQAITEDLNPLTYEWYREKNGEITKLENIATIDGDSITSSYKVNAFTFAEYNPKVWPTERPVMTFWIEDVTNEPYGYSVYRGEWPAEKPENIVLYTRKTSLYFEKNGGDVTGNYFVRGINRNQINEVFTDSGKCLIAAPIPVEIEKDLPESMFLSDNKELSITLNGDKGNPSRIYTLIKDGEVKTTNTPTKNDSVTFTLADKEFGVYQIKVLSKLNRGEEEKTSTLCSVFDDPIAPVASFDIYKYDFDDAEVGDIVASTEVSEGIKQYDGNAATTYLLKIDLDENIFTDYNKGSISYVWEQFLQDGTNDYIVIEGSENPNSGNIATSPAGLQENPHQLVVRTLDESYEYTYRCTITNKIANKETTKEFIFVLK